VEVGCEWACCGIVYRRRRCRLACESTGVGGVVVIGMMAVWSGGVSVDTEPGIL
jgi:hypothetical protein